MLLTTLLVLSVSTQATPPAIEPGSVYGTKTYTTNAEFGLLPDKFVVAFPPASEDDLTMHVMKGSQELVGGTFYWTESPYPTFKVLRFKPVPTITIPEPGDYVFEFRNSGQVVSRLPFTLARRRSGDEFNQTVTWDFLTPFDRMGGISMSNSEDRQVILHAWFAPAREGLANRSTAKIEVIHGGKVVAHALDYMFQEPQNAKQAFKLLRPEGQGRAAFNKSALLSLNGPVTAKISVGGKTIRTFVWNIAGGKIAGHPRSASDFSPRTDYWPPRRLGLEINNQFWHLDEVYWTPSK